MAMEGLRGVSLSHNILMTGKIISCMTDSKSTIIGGRNGSDYQDYVLQFNPDDESWTQVGKLKVARGWHGASLVQVEDVFDVCK